jgi:hypothetical protein
MEEDAAVEEHRATWGQAGADGVSGEPPSRKRPAPEAEEEEEELDDDVRRRLAALRRGQEVG